MSSEKETPQGQASPEARLESRLASLKAAGGEGAPRETAIVEQPGRGEVSATAVGMMLGLATSGELRLLEGKLDLMASKVSNLTVRMEKVLSAIQQMPTGSDLERIDVQIGALRSMIRDFLTNELAGRGVEDEDPAPRGEPRIQSTARSPRDDSKTDNQD